MAFLQKIPQGAFFSRLQDATWGHKRWRGFQPRVVSSYSSLSSHEKVVIETSKALVIPMMRLDATNRRDWQGFTRILEIMTFLDKIDAHSGSEIRETIESFCELPPNPGQTMSMEEVVFWAGVATGMEYQKCAEAEDGVDASDAEKLLVYSSIFAHSIKNAIVDLALGDLEPGETSKRDLGTYAKR